jgi:hypothetical protein
VFKGFSERFVSNVKQKIPHQAVSMEQCHAPIYQCARDVHSRAYRLHRHCRCKWMTALFKRNIYISRYLKRCKTALSFVPKWHSIFFLIALQPIVCLYFAAP